MLSIRFFWIFFDIFCITCCLTRIPTLFCYWCIPTCLLLRCITTLFFLGYISTLFFMRNIATLFFIRSISTLSYLRYRFTRILIIFCLRNIPTLLYSWYRLMFPFDSFDWLLNFIKILHISSPLIFYLGNIDLKISSSIINFIHDILLKIQPPRIIYTLYFFLLLILIPQFV